MWIGLQVKFKVDFETLTDKHVLQRTLKDNNICNAQGIVSSMLLFSSSGE